MSMLLFDFSAGDAAAPWSIQNDGVMGGKSKGTFDIADGHLSFTGYTVTRGGGFSSVLAEASPNLTGYTGVELRVRGGGRDFDFAISDGTRSRGREIWRRKSFATAEEWQTVRIPFSELNATAHGEKVAAPALKMDGIALLGFYIIDGKDGDFRLDVDYVKAY